MADRDDRRSIIPVAEAPHDIEDSAADMAYDAIDAGMDPKAAAEALRRAAREVKRRDTS